MRHLEPIIKEQTMSLPKEAIGWNAERIEAEIKSREVLMNQMVGSLYPSIISDELVQLDELLRQREIGALRKDIRAIYGEDITSAKV